MQGNERWRPSGSSNPSARLRAARSMPQWLARGSALPPPPPPPQIEEPIVHGDPDYEVIEFSGQTYSNTPLQQEVKMRTGRVDGRRCDLCGSSAPSVQCAQCSQQNFCPSCDEMYHRHPKRQAHVRKRLDMGTLRPPLPPKGEPHLAPVPPPRRNKRFVPTMGRPTTPSPILAPPQAHQPKKDVGIVGSLRRMITGRPLPPPPAAGRERLGSIQPSMPFQEHQAMGRNFGYPDWEMDRTSRSGSMTALNIAPGFNPLMQAHSMAQLNCPSCHHHGMVWDWNQGQMGNPVWGGAPTGTWQGPAVQQFRQEERFNRRGSLRHSQRFRRGSSSEEEEEIVSNRGGRRHQEDSDLESDDDRNISPRRMRRTSLVDGMPRRRQDEETLSMRGGTRRRREEDTVSNRGGRRLEAEETRSNRGGRKSDLEETQSNRGGGRRSDLEDGYRGGRKAELEETLSNRGGRKAEHEEALPNRGSRRPDQDDTRSNRGGRKSDYEDTQSNRGGRKTDFETGSNRGGRRHKDESPRQSRRVEPEEPARARRRSDLDDSPRAARRDRSLEQTTNRRYDDEVVSNRSTKKTEQEESIQVKNHKKVEEAIASRVKSAENAKENKNTSNRRNERFSDTGRRRRSPVNSRKTPQKSESSEESSEEPESRPVERRREEESSTEVNGVVNSFGEVEDDGEEEEEEKPLGPIPTTEWECEHCTFVNQPGSRVCVVCCKTTSAPKPIVPLYAQVKLSEAVNKMSLANHVQSTSPQPSAKKGQTAKENKSLTSKGTSPPPQSISTQTYEVPNQKLKRTVSLAENEWNTPQRSYSRQSLLSDTQSLPVTPPRSRTPDSESQTESQPDSTRRTSEPTPVVRNQRRSGSQPPEYISTLVQKQVKQGLEMVKLLREAEEHQFTADDLGVALSHCGDGNPVAWLVENWRNMIDTVVTLATNYGHERKENTIGTISASEARDALRTHNGNVWAAVTECVEQRQAKYGELLSRGNFTREDIVTALTANHGNMEAAFVELSKSQLKPFLMRIWGPPQGADNDSGDPSKGIKPDEEVEIAGRGGESRDEVSVVSDSSSARVRSWLESNVDDSPKPTNQVGVTKESRDLRLKRRRRHTDVQRYLTHCYFANSQSLQISDQYSSMVNLSDKAPQPGFNLAPERYTSCGALNHVPEFRETLRGLNDCTHKMESDEESYSIEEYPIPKVIAAPSNLKSNLKKKSAYDEAEVKRKNSEQEPPKEIPKKESSSSSSESSSESEEGDDRKLDEAGSYSSVDSDEKNNTMIRNSSYVDKNEALQPQNATPIYTNIPFSEQSTVSDENISIVPEDEIDARPPIDIISDKSITTASSKLNKRRKRNRALVDEMVAQKINVEIEDNKEESAKTEVAVPTMVSDEQDEDSETDKEGTLTPRKAQYLKAELQEEDKNEEDEEDESSSSEELEQVTANESFVSANPITAIYRDVDVTKPLEMDHLSIPSTVEISEGNSDKDVSPIPTDSERELSSASEVPPPESSVAKIEETNNTKQPEPQFTSRQTEILNLLKESLSRDVVIERIVASLFTTILNEKEELKVQNKFDIGNKPELNVKKEEDEESYSCINSPSDTSADYEFFEAREHLLVEAGDAKGKHTGGVKSQEPETITPTATQTEDIKLTLTPIVNCESPEVEEFHDVYEVVVLDNSSIPPAETKQETNEELSTVALLAEMEENLKQAESYDEIKKVVEQIVDKKENANAPTEVKTPETEFKPFVNLDINSPQISEPGSSVDIVNVSSEGNEAFSTEPEKELDTTSPAVDMKQIRIEFNGTVVKGDEEETEQKSEHIENAPIQNATVNEEQAELRSEVETERIENELPPKEESSEDGVSHSEGKEDVVLLGKITVQVDKENIHVSKVTSTDVKEADSEHKGGTAVKPVSGKKTVKEGNDKKPPVQKKASAPLPPKAPVGKQAAKKETEKKTEAGKAGVGLKKNVTKKSTEKLPPKKEDHVQKETGKLDFRKELGKLKSVLTRPQPVRAKTSQPKVIGTPVGIKKRAESLVNLVKFGRKSSDKYGSKPELATPQKESSKPVTKIKQPPTKNVKVIEVKSNNSKQAEIKTKKIPEKTIDSSTPESDAKTDIETTLAENEMSTTTQLNKGEETPSSVPLEEEKPAIKIAEETKPGSDTNLDNAGGSENQIPAEEEIANQPKEEPVEQEVQRVVVEEAMSKDQEGAEQSVVVVGPGEKEEDKPNENEGAVQAQEVAVDEKRQTDKQMAVKTLGRLLNIKVIEDHINNVVEHILGGISSVVESRSDDSDQGSQVSQVGDSSLTEHDAEEPRLTENIAAQLTQEMNENNINIEVENELQAKTTQSSEPFNTILTKEDELTLEKSPTANEITPTQDNIVDGELTLPVLKDNAVEENLTSIVDNQIILGDVENRLNVEVRDETLSFAEEHETVFERVKLLGHGRVVVGDSKEGLDNVVAVELKNDTVETETNLTNANLQISQDDEATLDNPQIEAEEKNGEIETVEESEVIKTVENPQPEETFNFEREVRRFLAEGLVENYDQAELAVQLMELKFDQEVSLMAAKECASVQSAITYLQQDCNLCAGKYPMNEMVDMLECEHRCCTECAQQYFTLQITERNINDCVCPFCKNPDFNTMDPDAVLVYFSHLDIILKGLLLEKTHELFQRKLRDRTLMEDPNFRWCAKCSSGFIANPRQRRLICPDCKSVTCANCMKLWEKEHEGVTCEDYAAWHRENHKEPDPEAEINKHLKDHGITCPKCKAKYSLAKGGCMHLTCPHCKHEFCSGCAKPFLMGDKCAVSQFCAKLGLHSHHPRNCLFYLRDKEPESLQKLLDENGVEYNHGTEENTGTRCAVQLLKETNDGLTEALCGSPVAGAGLCRTHYIEHLVKLIWENRLDPVVILDQTEVQQELWRKGKPLPNRPDHLSDNDYLHLLVKMVQEEIPLE